MVNLRLRGFARQGNLKLILDAISLLCDDVTVELGDELHVFRDFLDVVQLLQHGIEHAHNFIHVALAALAVLAVLAALAVLTALAVHSRIALAVLTALAVHSRIALAVLTALALGHRGIPYRGVPTKNLKLMFGPPKFKILMCGPPKLMLTSVLEGRTDKWKVI